MNVWNVLKFGGAFVAFLIGAGFATGQEIMQFFTGFGLWGIIGAVISMFLFAWSGVALMTRGYDIRDKDNLNHPFDYWFIFKEKGKSPLYAIGKSISVFYEYLIVLFLFLVVVVMIAGAGATMEQYYRLPAQIGGLIMALLVLVSVLFGLKKLINIIGTLGPLIILFTIIIALYAIFSNPGGLAGSTSVMAEIDIYRGAGSWWIAGVLYTAYNAAVSVPFQTSVGAGANSRREAKLGAILGAVMLMTAGILLILGQLTYSRQMSAIEGSIQVPNLYLTELMPPFVGLVFSIVILAAIFSTAAPMLWSTCSKFTKEGTAANKILIIALSVFAYIVVHLFPYNQLIGVIYPRMGWIGIFLLICILFRQIMNCLIKTPSQRHQDPSL